MKNRSKHLPAGAWHVPAAFLALILTACLWATQLGVFGLQAMTSVRLHERVALDQHAVESQMDRIAKNMAPIAEEYGFDAGKVTAVISREQVEELDRQVVRWWTGIFSTGEIADVPGFHAELGDILRADARFTAGLNEMQINGRIESVQTQVDEMVRKSGVLFRDQLIRAVMQKATARIDLKEAVSLIQMLPWIAGAACLLLAGLIALMMSRKIQTAGQYIGGALSACGLLMLGSLLLFRQMNLEKSIGEASLALQAQYLHLARILRAEVIGTAIIFFILGGLAMGGAVKARRKNA